MCSAGGSVAIADKDIGSSLPRIVLSRVDCIGTEDDITKCPQDNSVFCANPGAGVICPRNSNNITSNLHSIANY